MFGKPSLFTRIAVGKLVGFLVGVIGWFALPFFGIDDPRFRLGVVLWYVLVGAAIGLAGVFRRTPVLHLVTPWWLRGPGIGASFNLALVLIAWDLLVAYMADGRFWGLTSPWWFLLDGAVIGFVIDGLATGFGADGPETARALDGRRQAGD